MCSAPTCSNEWTTVFNAAKVLSTNSDDARAVHRTLIHQKGGVVSELKTPKKNLVKDENLLSDDELVKPLTEEQFKTKGSTIAQIMINVLELDKHFEAFKSGFSESSILLKG